MKYCVDLKETKALLLPNCQNDQERQIINSLFIEGSNQFSYPFVESDRFVYWMQNTIERHRAAGQRSFWISKHSDFASMTENELQKVIDDGGQEFRQLVSSMQSFNANIAGSNQYLYKKRKLLESLCEQKVSQCIHNFYFISIFYPVV